MEVGPTTKTNPTGGKGSQMTKREKNEAIKELKIK